MNFQQRVLAHMRAKFPDVKFEDGPKTKHRDFDPKTDCEVTWDDSQDEALMQRLQDESSRFIALCQFCSGLESLTRATGVVLRAGLHEADDDMCLIPRTTMEITDRHHYFLDEDETIEWRQELDS